MGKKVISVEVVADCGHKEHEQKVRQVAQQIADGMGENVTFTDRTGSELVFPGEGSSGGAFSAPSRRFQDKFDRIDWKKGSNQTN